MAKHINKIIYDFKLRYSPNFYRLFSNFLVKTFIRAHLKLLQKLEKVGHDNHKLLINL
jgi:hypothetical protein